MSNGKAECKSCGNTWKMRKPKEEIEVPRCSECGETGDSIQMGIEQDGQDNLDRLSVVEQVELEERHTDLQKRARRVAGRIKNIGGSKVPDELESCNRRLLAIEDKLSGQPSLSDSDLDEVADFIDEQEMQIEDLDEVDEITDLQIRVDELQAEIEQLEEQKNTLLRIIEAGGSMVQS
jgi:hypothetical protein